VSASCEISELRNTGSDHEAILFSIGPSTSRTARIPVRGPVYKESTLDCQSFANAVSDLTVAGPAHTMSEQLSHHLQQACDVSIAKSKHIGDNAVHRIGGTTISPRHAGTAYPLEGFTSEREEATARIDQYCICASGRPGGL